MSEYAKAAYWIESAEYDLQTAKAMLLQSLTPERCGTLIAETEALFLWLKTKC